MFPIGKHKKSNSSLATSCICFSKNSKKNRVGKSRAVAHKYKQPPPDYYKKVQGLFLMYKHMHICVGGGHFLSAGVSIFQIDGLINVNNEVVRTFLHHGVGSYILHNVNICIYNIYNIYNIYKNTFFTKLLGVFFHKISLKGGTLQLHNFTFAYTCLNLTDVTFSVIATRMCIIFCSKN